MTNRGYAVYSDLLCPALIEPPGAFFSDRLCSHSRSIWQPQILILNDVEQHRGHASTAPLCSKKKPNSMESPPSNVPDSPVCRGDKPWLGGWRAARGLQRRHQTCGAAASLDVKAHLLRQVIAGLQGSVIPDQQANGAPSLPALRQHGRRSASRSDRLRFEHEPQPRPRRGNRGHAEQRQALLGFLRRASRTSQGAVSAFHGF